MKIQGKYLVFSFLVGVVAFASYHLGRMKMSQPDNSPLSEKIDNYAKRAASRQLVSQNKSEEDQLSIENQLNLAIELVDNGDVDEAADILSAVLEVEPGNIKALLEMSLIELLDRGRPENALPYLVTALQVDPDNDHLLGEVADIYVETGQFDEGLHFFTQLKNHFPKTPAINLRVGQIHYYRADYDRALKVLDPVAKSISHGSQAKSLRARIYLQQGKLDESLDEYQDAENGLQEFIRQSMVSGEPTDFLVKWLETMQLEMAEGLIDRQMYKTAEDILYELSEKTPSDPEVVKLMDMAKAGRQGNSG